MTKTFEIIIHVTGTKAEIEKAQKHLEKGPNSIRIQSAKELQEPSKNNNMELPTKKVKASRKSPKNMIIYGAPKIGKTTALSQLDECLIIDLEDGSDMVDALKIKVTSLKELQQAGGAIMKAGRPYKYIAVDTISKLEEWCEEEGKTMYQATPQGKNFDRNNEGLSVLSLPNGGGYLYLRRAYKKWIDKLNLLADHVILIGHLKDKMLEKKGKEVAVADLDLTGKIKQISCANADAIGYLYREGDQTMISFNSLEDTVAGSRCEHLKRADHAYEMVRNFYRLNNRKMIDMRTQKPGKTPPKISVMQIDQDLKDGINKSDIAIKYGIKKWEVDRIFEHSFLKGRKPSRKKMLSFEFVDDSPTGDEYVDPNQVTLHDAIDDAIESCEQAKEELTQAAEEIEDILSPTEFQTEEDLVEELKDLASESADTAKLEAIDEEEDELEMDDDTFEM